MPECDEPASIIETCNSRSFVDPLTLSFLNLFRNAQKCPRFGNNKNNIGESVAQVFRIIRNLFPPDSCTRFLDDFNTTMRNHHMKKIHLDKSDALRPLARTNYNACYSNDHATGQLRSGAQQDGPPAITYRSCSLSSFSHEENLTPALREPACSDSKSTPAANSSERVKIRPKATKKNATKAEDAPTLPRPPESRRRMSGKPVAHHSTPIAEI